MFNFLKKVFTHEPEGSDASSETSQLALQIFERARQEHATEILFGVPPGESYDRSEHETFSQEPDEEVREFAKSQGLDVKVAEPIELSSIPVYMKIKNEWHMVLDIPMCLHSDCINSIKSFYQDFSMASMTIEMPLENSIAIFNFNTNENFNYLASDLTFQDI